MNKLNSRVMIRTVTRTFFGLGLVSMAVLSQAQAAVREFTLTAVEASGTRFWLPSTLIVKKGDTVKITAVSRVGGSSPVHGLAIDAFHIQREVGEKPEILQFVADKEGIFPIRCHMHPAHVGGQLFVQP
jgi:plastocyanin